MKTKEIKNAYVNSVVITLFMLAAAVHFYKIGIIPFGNNVDEVGMGYDAYCLNNFGVDRYLNSYPLYLINFGGGQSVMYAYMCSFLLNFMDLSIYSVRIPGIIVFLISFICIWKSMKLIDNSNQKGLWYIFLVAISPVYIMLFRIGMDCNLMLAMVGIFFYFMFRATYKDKLLDYIIAGIFAGLLLYTYALSYLVEFCFLIMIFAYLVWLKKIKLNNAIAFVIPLGLIAMPLIIIQIINIFNLDSLQFGIFTLSKIPNYRSGEINIHNINVYSIWKCIKVIFLHDNLAYNSVAEFGTVYYVSIPFALLGIIVCIINTAKSIKYRCFSSDAYYLVWFLVIFIMGTMIDSNVNRLNGIYISILYFIVNGIISFVKICAHISSRINISVAVVAIYIVCFIAFGKFYFGQEYREKYDPLPFFDYSLDEPLAYIEQHVEYGDKIVYIDGLSQNYIHFLFSTKISPYDYNESYRNSGNDFSRSYNNYVFGITDEDVNTNSIYIIDNDYTESMGRELEELGYTQKEFKHYSVYISYVIGEN